MLWWASLSANNTSSHLCIDKRAVKNAVTPISWTIQLLGVFLVALVPAILKSERVEVKFTD